MKTLLTSFAAFTLLLAVVESGAPEQPSHRSKLVVRCDPEASIAHISVGDDPPLIVMYNGEGVRILRVPEAFKFQVQLDRKTKERTFDLIWFEKRVEGNPTELRDAIAVTADGVRILTDDEFRPMLREYRFASSVIQELEEERGRNSGPTKPNNKGCSGVEERDLRLHP